MRHLSISLSILLLCACSADPQAGDESLGSGGQPGSGGAATTGGAAMGGAATGGVLPTGGTPATGAVGPVGGTPPGSGGVGATGGTPGSGGVGATGGATGGFGPTGGMAGTGGGPVGGTAGTGGVGGTAGSGGVATGGTAVTGGAPPTGGVAGTGGMQPPAGGTAGLGGQSGGSAGEPAAGGTPGSGGGGSEVVYDCGLPPAGDGGKPRPSGATANLKVLDWAGFSSAVSYSFDDSNSSQISHYAQMNALGVHFTFYLQTGKQESNDPIWQTALADGHELGNHTQNHTCGSSDIDSGASFIESHFGIPAYTLAAPNGDTACQASASKYLMVRSVSGGQISPMDNTNPGWIPSYIPGTMNVAAGKWQTYTIHGFTGGSDGAYQPIAFETFTAAVEQAKSSGAWVDSILTVGSYWIAQKAFASAGSNAWTWDLPANFPPNQCLRVTVDGGTLSQDDGPIAWDEHGYYEISLDAGDLTWTP
jgi:hypothetical protein